MAIRFAYNARYAKLRRQIGKVKFVVEQTLNIASRHLCTFARFEIVIDKIIGCEKVIQLLRNAFLRISPYTQDIRITPSFMSCKPSLAEVWTNIRQEDVANLICRDVPRRRLRR